MTPEESYAKAMAAYNAETFKRRVYRCSDRAKLRAVIEHESQREGETRRERVAVVNKRLQKLRD